MRTLRADLANALAPLHGVQHVAVDIPAKQVRVTYDERLVTVERMQEVLQHEDYPVASVVKVPPAPRGMNETA